MDNQASREVIEYEYRIESTPKYISPINEFWEIHQVFHSYLPNGHHNFIAIFRRQLKPAPTKEGDSSNG